MGMVSYEDMCKNNVNLNRCVTKEQYDSVCAYISDHGLDPDTAEYFGKIYHSKFNAIECFEKCLGGGGYSEVLNRVLPRYGKVKVLNGYIRGYMGRMFCVKNKDKRLNIALMLQPMIYNNYMDTTCTKVPRFTVNGCVNIEFFKTKSEVDGKPRTFNKLEKLITLCKKVEVNGDERRLLHQGDMSLGGRGSALIKFSAVDGEMTLEQVDDVDSYWRKETNAPDFETAVNKVCEIAFSICDDCKAKEFNASEDMVVNAEFLDVSSISNRGKLLLCNAVGKSFQSEISKITSESVLLLFKLELNKKHSTLKRNERTFIALTSDFKWVPIRPKFGNGNQLRSAHFSDIVTSSSGDSRRELKFPVEFSANDLEKLKTAAADIVHKVMTA